MGDLEYIIGPDGARAEGESAAEAKDAPPVASVDSTPTNWFELGASLCAEGRIPSDRLERAFEAVRLGVARA